MQSTQVEEQPRKKDQRRVANLNRPVADLVSTIVAGKRLDVQKFKFNIEPSEKGTTIEFQFQAIMNFNSNPTDE